MEARICDNQIVVPIGTAISFKMVAKNQQKIDLKVTASEENSKFFVLFDENDVDFQIEINNTKCIHGIGYTLIVNNGFYDYYIGAGERWLMEALYTKGRKLHFISQNSEEGNNVIKQTAEEYDISYSESAALCSRIEFNFEVEKLEPKPLPRLEGKSQTAFKKGKSFLPSFGSLSANRTLSLGRDVPDSSCFSYSDSQMGQSVPSLSNLGTEQALSKKEEKTSPSFEFAAPDPLAYDLRGTSNQSSNIMFGDARVKPLGMCMSSLAAKWKPEQKEQTQEKNEPQIGDKGVVCFGEQSNQLYNTYNGFTKDKNLEIKPFVVELRFSK